MAARVIGIDDPNAKVQIRDARDLAQKYDLQGVLIIAIRKDGWFDSVTFGDHPAQKMVMGEIADRLTEPVRNDLVPYRTMFGVGNDGIPKRLDNTETALHLIAGYTHEEIEAQTHPDATN